MKFEIKILTVCITVLFLLSCDKLKNLPFQTISGYLYEDCDMQPCVNCYIDVFEDHGGFQGKEGGLLTSGYTDANGCFNLSFQRTAGTSIEPIRLRDEFGDIMNGFLYNIDSANVILYRQPTCNIQVSLNVINPHEEGDTLIIGNFTTLENMAVPCPLSSGVLYTSSDFPLFTMYYSGESKDVNYYFTPHTNNDIFQNFVIDKYCNDTVFVTIDIY